MTANREIGTHAPRYNRYDILFRHSNGNPSCTNTFLEGKRLRPGRKPTTILVGEVYIVFVIVSPIIIVPTVIPIT